MAKIPVEFRSKEFCDDILISSFSSFPGVVVPVLTTINSCSLFFVGSELDSCLGKGILSIDIVDDVDLDFFVNSCIMYKKYFSDRLTSVYFTYLDDEKTILHVIFYLD